MLVPPIGEITFSEEFSLSSIIGFAKEDQFEKELWKS
jgi:hypothetical protein